MYARVQVDQALPDYRPKPVAVTNETVFLVHGPPEFLGYVKDNMTNSTHALISHTKLDHLGVNTGEAPLVCGRLET